jgi:hypothetical protein
MIPSRYDNIRVTFAFLKPRMKSKSFKFTIKKSYFPFNQSKTEDILYAMLVSYMP